MVDWLPNKIEIEIEIEVANCAENNLEKFVFGLVNYMLIAIIIHITSALSMWTLYWGHFITAKGTG